MTGPNELDRRALLSVGLAVGASSAVGPSTAFAAPSLMMLNPADPADQLMIFRKLAYAMDERVGFWWLRGIRYGLVDTKLIPFWNINIGSLFTTRSLPGDEFEVTRLGATFYTDLESDKLLRTFVNPINNKTVHVPAFAPRPVKVRYDRVGLQESPAERAEGRTGSGAIGPAMILGDHVWVQSDHITEIPSPGQRPIRVNDIVTYFGSMREVADPANTMPNAGHAFTDINEWPSWLELGDLKGDYYSRCYGTKAFAFADMPILWRNLLAQEYPAVAADPLKALRS